jgi:TPR repeat protein
MMKLIQAGIVAVVVSLGCVSAWAGPQEDYRKGWEYFQAKDYAEAVKLYRKAAEQGNASAQFNLGNMYSNGEGVTPDDTEAVKWYRKAADQGHASAQLNLGNMYDNGEGVMLDDTKAVKWYRKAAEQGHAKAQFNLGIMYAIGEGVPQDHVTAHMWYNLGGSSGNKLGAENRDELAKTMTPADVSEAQRRARVCKDSNYQNCD